jgi:hypothetical protein
MFELIYTSAAVRLFNPGELVELLKKARASNQRDDVSGILLYQDGSFMQVLEGAEESVRRVYDKVARDKRHFRLQVVREGAIPARRFAQWSMGFVSLDAALVRGLVGRHALLSNGTLGEDTNEVSALLDRFRDGEFRRYVLG